MRSCLLLVLLCKIVSRITYPFHSVVEIAAVDNLAIEQTALAPPQLPVPLLVDEQPAPELLRVDFQKAGKLLQVHGRVKLEVTLDGGRHHGVLHLVHEDAEVVLDGVNVDFRVVEVRRSGVDELGASGAEKLLEERQVLRPAALQPVELLSVLLAKRSVDGVVQAGGVEGHADHDECVHLVVLLGDGIVLGILLEVLRPRDVDEDVAEHADGIGIAAHHHVRETDIVVCGELGGHDAGEHGLLVKLNVVQSLQCQAEVSQQAVHAQKTDDGEVSKHLVQRS